MPCGRARARPVRPRCSVTCRDHGEIGRRRVGSTRRRQAGAPDQPGPEPAAHHLAAAAVAPAKGRPRLRRRGGRRSAEVRARQARAAHLGHRDPLGGDRRRRPGGVPHRALVVLAAGPRARRGRGAGARRGCGGAGVRWRRRLAGAARRPALDPCRHARVPARAPVPLPRHRGAVGGDLRAQGPRAPCRARHAHAPPRPLVRGHGRPRHRRAAPLPRRPDHRDPARRGGGLRGPRRRRRRGTSRRAAVGERSGRAAGHRACGRGRRPLGPRRARRRRRGRAPRRRLGGGHDRLGAAGSRSWLGADAAAPRRGHRASARP